MLSMEYITLVINTWVNIFQQPAGTGTDHAAAAC